MQKKAVRGKSHGTANELFLGRLGRDGLGLGLGLAEVGGEVGLARWNGLSLDGTLLDLAVGLPLVLGDGEEGAYGGGDALGGAYGETRRAFGTLGIQVDGDGA